MGCSLVNAPGDFQGGDVGTEDVLLQDASDGMDAMDASQDVGNDVSEADGGPNDSGFDTSDPDVIDAGPPPPQIVQLEAGRAHACALLLDGRVICWGSNVQEQCGHSDMGPGFVTTDLRFQSIALGENISCGVTFENEAHCWGEVESTAAAGPFYAFDGVVESVSVGTMRSMNTLICVEVGGNVDCYLQNALAAPANLNMLFGDFWDPEMVNVDQLSLGANHFVYQTVDGVVRSFGGDALGQQGDGALTDQIVRIDDVVEVVAALNRSCASTEDTVFCWGQSGSQPKAAPIQTERHLSFFFKVFPFLIWIFRPRLAVR